MALLREKTSTYTKLSIPLMGGRGDDNWKDNSWLIDHLRNLADTIEEEQPRIMDIGLETGVAYKIPNLYIKVFETREEEKMKAPKFEPSSMMKYAAVAADILEIKDLENFHGRQQLAEKHDITIQEVNWFIHKAMFGVELVRGVSGFFEAMIFEQNKK